MKLDLKALLADVNTCIVWGGGGVSMDIKTAVIKASL